MRHAVAVAFRVIDDNVTDSGWNAVVVPPFFKNPDPALPRHVLLEVLVNDARRLCAIVYGNTVRLCGGVDKYWWAEAPQMRSGVHPDLLVQFFGEHFVKARPNQGVDALYQAACGQIEGAQPLQGVDAAEVVAALTKMYPTDAKVVCVLSNVCKRLFSEKLSGCQGAYVVSMWHALHLRRSFVEDVSWHAQLEGELVECWDRITREECPFSSEFKCFYESDRLADIFDWASSRHAAKGPISFF